MTIRVTCRQAAVPGSCAGVLRSWNAGQAWASFQISTSPGATPPADCVYGVAPLSTTQVYAVTKAGLWRGTFTTTSGSSGTMSWTQLRLPDPIGTNQRVSSIFYPQAVDPNTFYIGLSTATANLNGIFKTVDGGVSWTITTFPTGIRVNAMGGLSANASTFYVAFGNGDVVQTNDGGATSNGITVLQGQRAGYPMATVAIAPNQPGDGTFYVGTVCQGGSTKPQIAGRAGSIQGPGGPPRRATSTPIFTT